MTDPRPRRIRLRVLGRVQGVWYRASAQDEAARLGLVGWVRNCADGAVEAVAEGPDLALEAFRKWCERGPPRAVVERVEVSEEPRDEALRGFTVRG